MSDPEDEPALTIKHEACELCGQPMPEGVIGWHLECGASARSGMGEREFEEWGGWRRASAATENGEPDPGPGTVCGGRREA